MKSKLLLNIDRHVRLFNNADEQMKGTHRFQVHGKLVHSPEDEDEFSVIIGDDPRGHGTNYISFGMKDVLDVEKAPSGILSITLR